MLWLAPIAIAPIATAIAIAIAMTRATRVAHAWLGYLWIARLCLGHL